MRKGLSIRYKIWNLKNKKIDYGRFVVPSMSFLSQVVLIVPDKETNNNYILLSLLSYIIKYIIYRNPITLILTISIYDKHFFIDILTVSCALTGLTTTLNGYYKWLNFIKTANI